MKYSIEFRKKSNITFGIRMKPNQEVLLWTSLIGHNLARELFFCSRDAWIYEV